MQLLAPSSLDDDLRAALRRRGYVFLPGVLDRAAVLGLRELVLRVLHAEGWIEGPAHQARPSSRVNRIGSPEFLKCIERLMRSETLHELAYQQAIIGLVRDLLGAEPFAHPRKMVRINYPYSLNPSDSIPAHQDLYYVKGERDTFTVWVPLGDYPLGRGGLDVLEQSHVEGLRPVHVNPEGRFNCTAAEVDDLDPRWRSQSYRAGDLVLFHALTVHRSSKNESETFRVSIDCRYSAAAGAINSDQLLPPYHPGVAPWPALTGDWKAPNRFQAPESLAIEAADAAPETSAARPSQYC